MAVTLQGGHGTDYHLGTGYTVAVDAGSATNRFLLSGTSAAAGGGPSASSINYFGASLTNIGTSVNSKVWKLLAPQSGVNNLIYTYSSYGSVYTQAQAFSGVDQTTPNGTVVTNNGTSNAPTTGSITCPSNGVVWGFEHNAYASGSAPSATAGTLLGSFRDGGSGEAGAHSYRTTTGALSWSIGGSPGWETIGVPINSASVAAPTATTLSGPSSGAVNVASTNFNVGTDNPIVSGSVVITPATSISGGGTFSPSTITLTSSVASGTFTFTPAKSGAHNITTTNNASLTNPSAVVYTVQPAVTVTLVASPTDSTPQINLTNLHWNWRDVTDVNSAAAPTDRGSTGTTNSSGVFTVALPNSTKTNGQSGLLEIATASATVVALGIVTVT